MHQVHPESQGHILEKIAHLVQEKRLFSTLNTATNATIQNLTYAHTILEKGQSYGKILLSW